MVCAQSYREYLRHRQVRVSCLKYQRVSSFQSLYIITLPKAIVHVFVWNAWIISEVCSSTELTGLKSQFSCILPRQASSFRLSIFTHLHCSVWEILTQNYSSQRPDTLFYHTGSRKLIEVIQNSDYFSSFKRAD